MTKFYIPVVFIVTLLLGFGLESCKKSAPDPFIEKYQEVVREHSVAQAIYDDVLKLGEDILMKNNNARINTLAAPLSCYSSIDTSFIAGGVKRYTVTFDPACTNYDGKVREGIIYFDLTGTNYNTTGAMLTVSFDNYSIQNYKPTGLLKSTNLGGGDFDVRVDDGNGDYAQVYISPKAANTKWKARYRKSIKSGNADAIILNNTYHITGSVDASLKTYEGITTSQLVYNGEPETYLYLNIGCPASGIAKYPLYGIINFNIADYTSRKINYGDSTCNRTAKMIYNDNQDKEIDLY